MKIYTILAASALVLGVLLSPAVVQQVSQVNAQAGSFFDVFIDMDGVQGGSPTHTNAIEVLSWSWGASNPTSVGSGGMGSGKVNMQDIHFTKRIDKASPMLYQLFKSGKKVKTMTLTVNNGGAHYLKITMTDVMVSSYGLGGGGSDQPTESVSFNFSKIKVDY